jgi:hypothetical protein
MTDGFRVAMATCAAVAALGGILAWLTISSDVLETEPEPDGDTPKQVSRDYVCPVAGAPLRPGREAACHAIASEKLTVTVAR